MPIPNIVLIILGLAAMVGGYFMTTHEGFIGWVLSYGKGAMWVKLLGEKRARTVTKFVFGPIALLFGLAMAAVAAFGGPISS